MVQGQNLDDVPMTDVAIDDPVTPDNQLSNIFPVQLGNGFSQKRKILEPVRGFKRLSCEHSRCDRRVSRNKQAGRVEIAKGLFRPPYLSQCCIRSLASF